MDDLDRWIHTHCICATCCHGIDTDLFGAVFCDRAESMAYGWNRGTSCCEEHAFRDAAMEAELKLRLHEWYEATHNVSSAPFIAAPTILHTKAEG